MITTIRLPLDSGRAATCSAAHSAAPQEMPGEQARAPRAAPGGVDRVVVGDRDHLVEQLAVEHRRARSPRRCPGCGAGRAAPPESTAEPRGSTATTRSSGLRLAQVLADAGDRAAGADARDEHVDAAVQRALDLRAGRAPVDLRVGGVGELVGQEHVGARGHRARGRHRLAHPAERLGDVHARAVQPQQALALAAHPLRQRQHEVIALGGAHERERDPGVAAGRLDDRRAARLDPALRPRRPRSSPRRCGP